MRHLVAGAINLSSVNQTQFGCQTLDIPTLMVRNAQMTFQERDVDLVKLSIEFEDCLLLNGIGRLAFI